MDKSQGENGEKHFRVKVRPGPNIPLNLPIIQELYSLLSTIKNKVFE